MAQVFLLALIALPIMLALDLTWVGVIANNFYRVQYGALYSPHVVWQAAAIFYVIYVLGLAYFVLAPAVRIQSLARAIITGAFFALIAYGTYDLTSLAITTHWPLMLTIVDMGWGVFCGAVTSAITYKIAVTFFKI